MRQWQHFRSLMRLISIMGSMATGLLLLGMSYTLAQEGADVKRQYAVTIDGSRNAGELSRGKAIHSMIRRIHLYKSLLPSQDYQILKNAKAAADSFRLQVLQESYRRLRSMCSRLVSEREFSQVDIGLVSAEIDAIGFGEWRAYDDYYIPLVASLSATGREIVNRDILPEVLKKQRHTRPDFVDWGSDQPAAVQRNFVESCRAIEASPQLRIKRQLVPLKDPTAP